MNLFIFFLQIFFVPKIFYLIFWFWFYVYYVRLKDWKELANLHNLNCQYLSSWNSNFEYKYSYNKLFSFSFVSAYQRRLFQSCIFPPDEIYDTDVEVDDNLQLNVNITMLF